ncbi:MAG: alpha/beta fold hydrolase [Pyrinomonadaceae bacterium]|nr:alpha/beta fold hydrolase [Pyrinomonadaceae bacterium]
MRKIVIMILMGLFGATSGLAQSSAEDIADGLVGHWKGSLIKGNSSQAFETEFYKKEDKLFSLQTMSEWHPAFGEFERPVKIGENGEIAGIFGLGKAKLRVDLNNLELIGFVESRNPGIYIHLKKVPGPPRGLFAIEPVTVVNTPVTLSGHFHVPAYSTKKTALVYVGGRGCYAGRTESNLYAKFLRNYGVAVLALQKRGMGNSTGNCETATIDDLAKDVAAAVRYLRKRGFERIGALGESAGGWVIFKASEMTKIDFLISSVGPSTSVRDQQMQSMSYGAKEYRLKEEVVKDLLEYTNMMFDAPATDESMIRFNELLKNSKENGWFEFLEDTDKPTGTEGIANLWVRRHSYDPRKALAAFEGPLLALYGDKDWIVPRKENIAVLRDLFQGTRSNNLRVHSFYNADHGMTVGDDSIKLPGNQSYFRFFRVTPKLQIEILSFLREYGLTDN